VLIPYPTYEEPHCGSSVIPLLGKLKPVTNHKVLPSWTCPIQQPLILMNIDPEDCQCLLESTCDLQIVGHRLLSNFLLRRSLWLHFAGSWHGMHRSADECVLGNHVIPMGTC
jgi:hypothetical protein